jgi:Ca2+-binding EF-hand superfamily protein
MLISSLLILAIKVAGAEEDKAKKADEVIVTTTDGKVYAGELINRSKKSIKLRVSDGVIIRIAANKIEEVRKKVAEKPAEKKKVQVVVSAGGALAARSAYGATPQAIPKDVAPDDKTERLLLMIPGGLLVIDVDVTIDGKPFRTHREGIVAKLLANADKDKNGKVSFDEALSYPTFASGRLAYVGRNDQQRKQFIETYDYDKDGLVDKNEMRALAAIAFGGAAFSVSNYGSRYGVGSPIFGVLDVDNDKMLSAEELAGAEQQLKTRDADDNDILTLLEIAGASGRSQYRQTRFVRGQTVASIVYHIHPKTDWTAVHKAILQKYGKDCRWTEFPATPELKAFDKNNNQQVEAEELSHFEKVKPHIHMEVNLGKSGGLPEGVAFKSVSDELKIVDQASSQIGQKQLLQLETCHLQLISGNPQMQNYNFDAQAVAFMRRFDTDENKYIEKQELEKVQKSMVPQFQLWDANQDGKVYDDEIKSFYQRSRSATMNRISVAAVDRGGWLLGLVDANSDSQLGLREMRTAAQRLKSADKNGDGQISADEVPSTVKLAVATGNYAYQFLAEGRQMYAYGSGRVVLGNGARPASPASQGPDWFVRMDRNGDGDVTMREFLGTKEQFNKLDKNTDGFIERKEAEAVAEQS